MTLKKIFASTAIAATAIVFANNANAFHANGATAVETIEPLRGISFDLGTKRAVSYYRNVDEHCKIVLTYSDPFNPDDVPSLTVTRFETALPAQRSIRYTSNEGASIEFVCHEGARTMSVLHDSNVASAPRR